MKKCSKCNVLKTSDNYHKDKHKKDGFACECKQCKKEYGKKYRKENEEILKAKTRAYTKSHKEQKREYDKRYRETHKDRLNKQQSIRHKSNRKKYTKRYLIRRQNDELFKLITNLRARQNQFLKGKNKSTSTKDILGCSLEQLKEHLSYRFYKRYNFVFDWESYVRDNQQFGWHIDHVIELQTAATEHKLYELCHYTNLEILDWEDNLEKKNKLC